MTSESAGRANDSPPAGARCRTAWPWDAALGRDDWWFVCADTCGTTPGALPTAVCGTTLSFPTEVMFSAIAIVGQIPGVATALGNATFFTDPMILEFVLGVIVGYVFINGRIGWQTAAAAACAIAAVLLSDPASRVIVSGIPAACLVAAAAWASRKRLAPSWPERALARLGDASYSIYLAQVETVSLASIAVAGLFPAIPPLLLLAVTSCIVVALGLALNIVVERPLLKLCRSLGGPRPRLAVRISDA